ncbi:helix-turn-helix transcriptional regulator [Thermopolyspora sp. NPDC052614]|uniref:helix-turn-helix domain-containing protein n=1 Tax=Thermopolyspora sp. NPDC052614 TaxID=3155682 RepID=UPI003434741A
MDKKRFVVALVDATCCNGSRGDMGGQSVTSGQTPWAGFGAVLRIWRDRRGISLRQLAEQIRWDHSVIARWEQGKNPPSADAIKALEGALDTGGELTEVALRAQAMEVERLRGEIRRLQGRTLPATPKNAEDDEMERRAAMQVLAALGTTAVVPPSAIQTILSGVNRAIGERDDFGLDEWERTVWEYAYRGTTGPLGSLIPSIAADIIEVGRLLDRNTNPLQRAGLLRVSSQLAALLAGELDDMGNYHAAWQSRRTARRAADASGDRDLAVWIRAREASGAYYTGKPGQIVIGLTDEAIGLAQNAPSAGLARAYEARAFALAAQGDRTGARDAVRNLSEVFDRLPRTVTTNRHSIGFSFPEEAAHWAAAHVSALVDDRRKSSRVLDETLATYPPELVHGVANLQYLQALSLIRDRDISGGLEHALTSAPGLPVNAARRRITSEMIKALPEKARALPAAQDLRALTALNTSSRAV